MKRIIACIISAAVLLATASAPGRTLKASGANWQEGVHYERISNDPVGKTADKIEILEFFQYTCPHCYTVEPFVTFLKQRVGDSATVTRVHVVYRPYQRSLARLYYTLQALGRIDSPDRNDVHHDIFDMFHRLEQPSSPRTMTRASDYIWNSPHRPVSILRSSPPCIARRKSTPA